MAIAERRRARPLIILAAGAAGILAGCGGDKAAAADLQTMLKRPLTAQSAVQIALINNPAFRAKLEGLGVAQADLIQAGIIENPQVHAGIFLPSGGGATQNGSEMDVTENFLDLVSLPLKKKSARARFEQAKLILSQDALNLTAQVKTAFYLLEGDKQRLALQKDILGGTKAAAELARRQRKAGNIASLNWADEETLYQREDLAWERDQAAAQSDRERLSFLMGTQEINGWDAGSSLPEISTSDPPLERLEAQALAQRRDLAAAKKEPEILKEALRINRLSLFGNVRAGIDSFTELNGPFGIGPTAQFGLPIFDRRQASSARLKSRISRSRYSIAQLEDEIRLEVRLDYDSLLIARKTAEKYRSEILPLRREIVEESLRRYNYMLLGAFGLIRAKQNEFEAERNYIKALADYWIARSKLERDIGASIEGGS
ncbi:MAG: TolC family protein [Elusimicrobiota bacterium]